ncbi:MAG: hypothetical protein OXS50_08400 [Gammaproteobacteria bacterium]|nr:hypothetical protein [Gammaproteobacteria bacterium]
MKLRIHGDSIRLRLTVGEVVAVGRGETVAETAHLGDLYLSYSLTPLADATAVDAVFDGGAMRVSLPAAMARRWAETEEVSLHGAAGAVIILIEKDFDCLEPREGDEKLDTFPNPKA